ncbi:MAG: phosphoglycerate kinase [Acidobacteria bacterium]|nr:phosphoglycerate kinase [Acidobacteriota bacterium]
MTLDDLPIENRAVLVRVDFNVPVADGRVADDTRIRAALPTIRRLREADARLVLMSHRGRPGGAPDPEFSMAPVAKRLGELLDVDVRLAPDCVGSDVREAVTQLQAGDVLLLENLRYHAGETANDPGFAAELAEIADAYVSDAFGVAHRAHASVVGVAGIVPGAAAGELLRREVETLSQALVDPPKPFVLILGGAKVADKVALIANVLPLVDRIVIGGAMANAFLAAQGRAIGGSLAPAEAIEQAGGLLVAAEKAGVEMVLPDDLIAAPAIDDPANAHVVREVAPDEMALDIGPDSCARFAEAIGDAQTVVWNGPMGVFETPGFDAGTRAVAAAVAKLENTAFTVIGGGDTAAAAVLFGIAERVSHVSTGGGASLDLLSGAVLPGVEALTDRTTLGDESE